MDLFRSAQAVAGSQGDGIVDWTAVAAAAKAATPSGDLDLSTEEQQGYRTDVREARDRLRSVGEVEFDLPETIEIQNRHHWIDANIATFRRVVEPLEEQSTMFPGVSRAVNTGTMAVTLGFLGRNVMGQYDPLLLADTDSHSLYFVRPNIQRVAEQLAVDYPRFRRWIAFHEVAHAAEFGAAPWLPGYLEDRMQAVVTDLTEGSLNREAYKELNTAMTAVEGYAELLMDQAFDEEYVDLRAKLDARRKGGGPFVQLMRRLLGLGMKRQQYERGAEFFEAVADARDIAAASAVWEKPENLPTDEELDSPGRWLHRVEK
ncbi:putative hydrolase/coenzyme F420 biosynthesis associated uncharacterized protein [Halohasta litchfieldiae]|uniref:Putative hydrolase/uncharacterized protein, coenzyme F420 biosynthesis associated n=1 Tax=Halohasta litchfieldiae TaxID=1073996 RepID=A0A1H6T3N3_9EURY|nr:zinc-dependent metalloprotease [Halohasta litchfieldiae]ATW86921.1 putative hydrolase/coenzyme F420 biosynthesis associated uncharacterized protein [Halohasta litchfieldiae]SEI70412.1 putative hydrolase/uncharacterized protein, coenzyme F420 biosynthesis associated [Halohasta litchfieldiae]